MRKKVIWAVAICLVFIGSCVTVNIYFPAAAVQKAADVIIEDIQGKAPEQKPEQPQQKPDQQPKQGSGLYDELKGTSFGPSVAYAAEVDLEISTPAIRALRESMKARYAQLSPYFDSGVIGIASTGFIAVRDASGLSLKDKAVLNGLVDQQNKDLKALYQEIVSANKFGPEKVADVQKIFADRWRANAKPGRWIQADTGAWVKK